MGLVPIARRWDSRRDTRHLADQLERLQEAIDSYPYLDVSTINLFLCINYLLDSIA